MPKVSGELSAGELGELTVRSSAGWWNAASRSLPTPASAPCAQSRRPEKCIVRGPSWGQWGKASAACGFATRQLGPAL